MNETKRRRQVQERFNTTHGIVPRGIKKEILPGIETEIRAQRVVRGAVGENASRFDARERFRAVEKEMLQAAERLDFERAAELRDELEALEKQLEGAAKPKRRR